MGAEQSLVNGEFINKFAFQILRIDKGSPADTAGLLPYFDYILSVNGLEIVSETPNIVADMTRNHVDRQLKMTLYNVRQNRTREVIIVPSYGWGGMTLLGAGIRFCSLSNIRDLSWHILDVSMNSPAHVAGFIPMKDWIIGSSDIVLTSQDDMYNLLIHNQKRAVRLLVYNIDTDSVREVTVVPNFEWGGEGCIGFDVASGALHRIPESPNSATASPAYEMPTLPS